jgi:hypothetical protein
MAEIAVEVEIARLDPGRGLGLDDIGRDLWWEERVGAAQDVEHLGLDPGEIRPGVKAEQGAAEENQRAGISFGGPVRGLLADRRLARRLVRETLCQDGCWLSRFVSAGCCDRPRPLPDDHGSAAVTSTTIPLRIPHHRHC